MATRGTNHSDDDGLGSKYPSTTNPTEVRDVPRISAFPPGIQYRHFRKLRSKAFGKWLVFVSFTKINETWHTIQQAIKTGDLRAKALAATCSTLYYRPTSRGPGPQTSGVIHVYTTKQDMDEIGYMLIEMVKQDIKYKTEKATSERVYAWRGDERASTICLKTIYWNDGEPCFELTKESPDPDCDGIEDVWHINEVSGPEPISNPYGHWVIVPKDQKNLTNQWQDLRKMIEDDKSLGPVKMVCPPVNEQEQIVFLVYTIHENIRIVGTKIFEVMKNSMRYELEESSRDFSSDKPVYNYEIIRVDEDDGPHPDLVMTLIKQ